MRVPTRRSATRSSRSCRAKIRSRARPSSFNVFAATFTKRHSPLFKPITVEADLAARTGRFFVDGVVDARIAPIRNPVTGKPSYAHIALPDGFEYEEAEIGSSSVRTMTAPIKLEWEGQHGHIVRLDMTGKGLVRGRAA
jgi:hypothetical protein